MNLVRWYFSKKYWLNIETYKVFATSILSVFGSLWLILEILSFFASNSVQPVKDQWALFLIVGVSISLFLTRPRLRHEVIIINTDVKIEIVADNFFKQTGDYVIGTNTTFDTSMHENYIHPRSIQGQFTKKYYASESHLDLDINKSLNGIVSTTIEKVKGKNNKFPIGTVAKVKTRDNYAYLVAIAHIHEKENTVSSIEELKTSFAELWTYIQNHGEYDKLVIPILGSGFARVSVTREYLAQEIVRSFVAAISDRKFCEHLVIVVNPKDVLEKKIDLQSVFDFLTYIGKYSNVRSNIHQKSGGIVS
jgi:hypothetical protein